MIVETVKALLDGAEQELEEEAVSVLLEAIFPNKSRSSDERDDRGEEDGGGRRHGGGQGGGGEGGHVPQAGPGLR